MRPTWIATIIAVVAVAGIAAYSVEDIGSTPSSSGTSTPDDSSSSLASSTSSSSVIQSSNQSTVQYPLVWGPTPLSVCEGPAFCINATLAFPGQQATNGTSSATTVTEGNATTIVRDSTTTVVQGVSTTWVFPSPVTTYPVAVTAFVRDAVTGQNATTNTPSGTPVISNSCDIQPTGVTHCLVGAPYVPSVPSGHPYDVTVFVTTLGGNTMLAPSATITVPAGTWGTTDNTSTQSSTSTSTTASSPACGVPVNTLLNPAPKGTVYMKVVTDQGSVITNGTLFVTQVGNATNGAWGLTNHYCIRLSDVNGTGFLQLAGNMTFIASGYYNVTLVAGYNQGSGYQATIPSILVHPNSTIFVTVTVPSGVVTVITSTEGSSGITTTTTSTTSIKSGG